MAHQIEMSREAWAAPAIEIEDAVHLKTGWAPAAAVRTEGVKKRATRIPA
jgi:hypothetical protein